MGLYPPSFTFYCICYNPCACPPYDPEIMEKEYEQGHFFHESLEQVEGDIAIHWTNPRRHDVTKPLEGAYYRVVGVPTYFVRFRRLGEYKNPNFEAIKMVKEEAAQVSIQLGEDVLYGRFLPIASSSEKDIARVVRDSWQNDLLKGINLDV